MTDALRSQYGLAVMTMRQADRHKRSFDAVLTLESPNAPRRERLRFATSPHPEHLVLRFEDVESRPDGVTAPTLEHARHVLEFGRRFARGLLLVHCHAGIGRSGAAALAVLADRLGPGREGEALEALLALRPEAVPNLLLTAAADEALGRDGALLAAVTRTDEARPDWRALRAEKARLLAGHPELYA